MIGIGHIRSKEIGAVSLFVVIFSMLLITVLTVGFIRIMIFEQQLASTSDLSQSAYDSALAGVEDAKRAILRCQANPSQAGCDNLNGDNCDTLERVGVVSFSSSAGNREVTIQSTNDNSSNIIDQAYTCVTINSDTSDYKGYLQTGESKLVPLDGVGSFNRIVLRWFTSSDSSGLDLDLPTIGSTSRIFPMLANWPSDRPAVMRTQLIQYGSSFRLNDFSEFNSNASTLFLYPSQTGAVDASFANDGRLVENGPTLIKCNSLGNSAYACSATINLPDPDESGTRTAYLRLSALYSNATFSVQLMNGGSVVNFNGVQPEVDSTGRANNIFRRVKARVETQSDFPYPESAVDVTGNLCKDFFVSTIDTGNQNNCNN